MTEPSTLMREIADCHIISHLVASRFSILGLTPK